MLGLTACLANCSDVPDQLVSNNQFTGDRIPVSLTDVAGNRDRGAAIFAERQAGHCVLCHQVGGLEATFQGNVGPDLSDVGSRLDQGQLRLRIVDYQEVQPGSLMPSYYRNHDLYQVAEPYRGNPILSAQDVEDLVAYLSDLKS